MIPAVALLIATMLPDSAAAAPATGTWTETVFDSYTPLSGSAELSRRMLSPLTAERIHIALRNAHQRQSAQAIDIAGEKFVLHVPAREPAQGYALMVFVPPWEDARMPAQWIDAFDRHGMIFVSAAGSGNAANVLDRREPLALLAAHNVQQRYRVDASRVYVGGFSGGSRVALRLALGYPDLFRGVLLNAGSDPIGDAAIPLPPTALFRQFQQSTRVVYLTGGHDAEHLEQDARSRRSLQEWCVEDISIEKMPWSGHETADPAALGRALTALSVQPQRDAEKSAACQRRIDEQLAARTGAIENLIGRGARSEARAALQDLDARYGGLGAPPSIELWRQIEAN